MTYLTPPVGLDHPKRLTDWLEMIQRHSHILTSELADHAFEDTLSEELATAYLDKFTWIMAAIEKAYEAIGDAGLEADVAAILTDVAKATHTFSTSMTQVLLEHLRGNGANAELLLQRARDRHFP